MTARYYEAHIVLLSCVWLRACRRRVNCCYACRTEPQAFQNRWIDARVTRSGINQSPDLCRRWSGLLSCSKRAKSSLADGYVGSKQRPLRTDLQSEMRQRLKTHAERTGRQTWK